MREAYCQEQLTAAAADGRWVRLENETLGWEYPTPASGGDPGTRQHSTLVLTSQPGEERDALLGCYRDSGAGGGTLSGTSYGDKSTLPQTSRKPPLWLHVVGASSMRFLYASLVSLFNKSTAPPPLGHPVHTLPNEDPCSFLRVRGWPYGRHPCVRRWRGRCYDTGGSRHSRVGCEFNVNGEGWRISFEWYHFDARNLPEQRMPKVAKPSFTSRPGGPGALESPDAVLLGFDLWEAPRAHNASEVESGLLNGIVEPIASALPESSSIILVGGGISAAQEDAYWRGFTGGTSSNATIRDKSRTTRHLINTTSVQWVVARQRRRDSGVDSGGVEAEGRTGHHHRDRARPSTPGTTTKAHSPGEGLPTVYWLPRAMSMETAPRLTSSPFFADHAYGLISDLHAALILRHLCRRQCK
jgi:hypothetical protein